MTRPAMHVSGLKAAVTAVALLCAAAALAILATSSVQGVQSGAFRTSGSASLENGPLGR